MPIPPQSPLAWTVSLTVLHVASLLSTVYRISHRWRIRRLWWDDYFAVMSLLVDLPLLIALWARYSLGPAEENHAPSMRVVLYWISALSFFSVIWLSRISMALSIARIFPPSVTPRRLTIGLAYLFGFFWVTLLLQTAIICSSDTSWHKSTNVQCTSTGQSNKAWISALSFDIFADLTLVTIPLWMLWRVKLPKNPRRLILSVFTASIWTCLASVALHTFILGPSSWGPYKGFMVAMMTSMEAAICLLVCNLLVVVTIYYRVFRNGEDIEDFPEGTDTPRNNAISRIIDFSRRSPARSAHILTTLGDSMLISESSGQLSTSDHSDADPSGSVDSKKASVRESTVESSSATRGRDLVPGTKGSDWQTRSEDTKGGPGWNDVDVESFESGAKSLPSEV